MKLILLLSLVLSLNAYPQKKSFSEKYQESLDAKSEDESVSGSISSLLNKRVKDLRQLFRNPAGIYLALFDYYGKRTRSYINYVMTKLDDADKPKVKAQGETLYLNYAGKIVSIKVLSFVSQTYLVNDTLEIEFRKFKSFEAYLDYMIPKLDVMLNSAIDWGKYFGISKAYAEIAKTPAIAAALALVFIHIAHGESDTCEDAYKIYLDEFTQLKNQCTQELRNLNPNNANRIKSIFITWETFVDFFMIEEQKSKKPCQAMGEYFDAENSIKCKYKKRLLKVNDPICQTFYKAGECVSKLRAGAAKFEQ